MKQINSLPDKEYKTVVIRMLTDLGRRMDEHSNNFNKELESIKKEPIRTEETIREMKNSLEGINSRVYDTEKWISELDKRIEEITQTE